MTWIKKILEKGEAYAVGGSVRDELMGVPVNDLDILVCHISSQDLEKILENEGQLHLVGKNFGVYVFKPHGQKKSYEIALPRKEKSTGIGHKDFDVQVDHNIPIEDDLRRRDFTINAIAKNLRDDSLIDPWGGQQDIKNRVLRQVFDETFKEDPLRMLRACQFVSRLDLEVEDNTFKGMCQYASSVNTVSAERIFHELEKLLKSKKPSLGFHLMHATGLLKEILPELQNTVGVKQPTKYHAYPVFEHILAVVDAAAAEPLSVRWAALCHDLGKPPSLAPHPKDGRPTFFGHEKISRDMAKSILERLKAPEALKKKVALLCQEHMFLPANELSDKALRRLIHRTGKDNIIELIYLRRADKIGNGVDVNLDDWEKLLERVYAELQGGSFSIKDLNLNGKDLINKLQLKQGPQLGKTLDHLLNHVLENPELNKKDILLQLAKEFMSSK